MPSKEALDLFTVGNVAVVPPTTIDDCLYFIHKGHGGLTRSDFIPVKNIEFVTTGNEASGIVLHDAVIEINSAALESSKPIVGQPYTLRVELQGIGGSADDSRLIKFGTTMAIKGDDTPALITRLLKSLQKNLANESAFVTVSAESGNKIKIQEVVPEWIPNHTQQVTHKIKVYPSIVTTSGGEEVYWQKVKNAAKAEIALRRVLKDEGATAFTTNFDDLGDADIDDPNFVGFDQIPGLASQRLMAEGIGFGAEGDWKTACLYRTLWFMSQGLPTGCSFLEDYTLNFAGDRSSCLQSHMLEVCPLIAVDKPKLEVHFLGIGIRKQQTARLVFTSKVGRGIKATVVDLGNRFRLITQEVECIEPKPMPNLPVASALWVPQPTFEIGAGAWILAGGTHHSAFSYDINEEYWEDFAEMLGLEYARINKNTTISGFKQDLRNNEVYYMLNKALK